MELADYDPTRIRFTEAGEEHFTVTHPVRDAQEGQNVMAAYAAGQNARHVTEEMVDRAVAAFCAQDLYEHSQQETQAAMRDALQAALSDPSA